MADAFQHAQCSRNLSRRGFFTLAAALGVAAATEGLDGLFVRAWADEVGATTSYKIYVVKRWELPLSFLDMTDPDNPKSVAGARITITSHYNQKSLMATTDDLGVAVVDITELADPGLADMGAETQAFAFYGSVLVEGAGYRTFETGKLYLRGGRQLDAPTEPLNGRPYVRCATIDGWDIQYAKSATFVSTPANTVEHEVVVKLADGAGRATIALGQEDGASVAGSATFENGVAACTMKARMFSANAADADVALQPGKDIFLKVELADAPQDSFTLATRAAVMRGAQDTAEMGTNAPFSVLDLLASAVSPAAPSTVSPAAVKSGMRNAAADESGNALPEIILLEPDGLNPFPLPEDLPVIGGSNLQIGSIIPALPITYTFDPFGFFVLGAGYATKFHRETSSWETDTFENSLQQFDDTRQKWKDDFDRWKKSEDFKALLGGKASRVGSLPLTKEFNLDFQAGGMLMMQWGDRLAASQNDFEGDLQLYMLLTGSAAFTKQFFASYVPFFLRAELAAAGRFTFDVGLAVRDGSVSFSPNASTSFTLEPSMAFTAALGVADLASIGVRGLGYVKLCLGFPLSLPDGKNTPRFTVGAGVDVSVAVQLALFKANLKVYEYSKPNLYDSWEEPARLQSAESVLRASSFDGGVMPVTQSELLGSTEFRAVSKAEPLLLRQGVGGAEDAGVSEDAALAEAAHGLYSYEPIARATRMRSRPTALQSFGVEGAVMSGGLVHGDAFSDPRMKIVSVKGVPWLLRILTVEYEIDGQAQARSRLSVAKWSESSSAWERPQVIDFAPAYPGGASGPAREALFDYDYAALSATDVDNLQDEDMWIDGSLVRVFLISGTRATGETETPGAALSHTVGTFLALGENQDGSIVIRNAQSFLDVYDRVPDAIDSVDGAALAYSTLVNPVVVSTRDQGGSNVTAVFAFCRAAASADALVSGPYEEKPATALFISDGHSLVGPNAFCYAEGTPRGITDDFKAMITDVKRSVSMGLISSSIAFGNQFFLGCHYTTENAQGESVLKSFAVVRNTSVGTPEQNEPGEVWMLGQEVPGVRFAYPWKAAGPASALCSTAEGLSVASFTRNASGAPTGVALSDVSLDKGIDLDGFALNENTGMLYYITAREGDVPVLTEEGGSSGQVEHVADYRIWASHYASIGGRQGFVAPFSLMQTADPIDSLAITNFDDAYGFMTNGIDNLDESLSNIMFYRLPFIRSVRLLDFASENEFVCAGVEEPFLVTVRNDGNIAVSSFTIAITADGMSEQRIELDLTDTDRVEPLVGVQDVSARKDERAGYTGDVEYREPEFSLAVQAGILNPGEVRSFRFTWLVPEVFSGRTDLGVIVLGDGENAPGAAGVEDAKLYAHAGALGLLGEQFAHEPVKSTTEFRAAPTFEAADGDGTWATKSRYTYVDDAGGAGNGGDGGDGGDNPDTDGTGGGGTGDTTTDGGANGTGTGQQDGTSGTLAADAGDDTLSTVAAAAVLAGVGAVGAGAQLISWSKRLDEEKV